MPQLIDATPMACALAAQAKLAYASVLLEWAPMTGNAKAVLDEAAALVAATVVLLQEESHELDRLP